MNRKTSQSNKEKSKKSQQETAEKLAQMTFPREMKEILNSLDASIAQSEQTISQTLQSTYALFDEARQILSKSIETPSTDNNTENENQENTSQKEEASNNNDATQDESDTLEKKGKHQPELDNIQKTVYDSMKAAQDVMSSIANQEHAPQLNSAQDAVMQSIKHVQEKVMGAANASVQSQETLLSQSFDELSPAFQQGISQVEKAINDSIQHVSQTVAQQSSQYSTNSPDHGATETSSEAVNPNEATASENSSAPQECPPDELNERPASESPAQ